MPVKQIRLLREEAVVRQEKYSFFKKYLVLSLPLLDICVIKGVIFKAISTKCV